MNGLDLDKLSLKSISNPKWFFGMFELFSEVLQLRDRGRVHHHTKLIPEQASNTDLTNHWIVPNFSNWSKIYFDDLHLDS
jgi:hypothetical protein